MANQRKVLEAEFTRAMFDIYEQARKLRPPYTPTAFRSMVAEHGGKGAADRLLEGSTPSSGFGELLLRGQDALRLSVEYLVLTEPWRQMFSPDQLEVARSRLREVGCELPADDLKPRFPEVPLPEEVGEPGKYAEGTVRRIEINAYERNAEARAKCIELHGASCSVCGFSFEETYGTVAAGFIHVHHLVPIAEVGDSYEVDPEQDLRPVCPNCHAVIHFLTSPEHRRHLAL
jgi:5-methylcytosine-specific restriction enzyme A